jgi:lysophospholipase L1-like esterase
MKYRISILFWFACACPLFAQADKTVYLEDVKTVMLQQWPANKTINLVFHGHSVPSGYFRTPDVRTLQAYPYSVLAELKKIYPYAVINTIVTAIGGENSEQGGKRFIPEVLAHHPDVLFIDYALNDRGMGLEKAKESWEGMIESALDKGIKVILLTPTPDTKENILDEDTPLAKHAAQIRELSRKYQTGLVDSYQAFKQLALSGEDMNDYMSQFNHPNEKGHQVVTGLIMEYLNP